MIARVLTVLFVFVPGLALACPVCFGENDSPMAQAMNLGVLTMLVIVAGVLAGFASFVIHLMRRARLADPSRPAAPERSVLESAGPQEGTV